MLAFDPQLQQGKIMSIAPARQFLSALCLGVAAVSAQASPVALTLGDFAASDTLVNFNSATNEAPIAALYSASGVTFSSELLGMTNSGDTGNFPGSGGGVIASNWNYGTNAAPGLSFTASFATLITRVGFYLSNWDTQTATVELFKGAASLGTLTLAQTASLDAEFRGIGEMSGFDRMVFTNTAETNGFYAIDDLRFANAVPEPQSYALALAGLVIAAGTAASRRRRQRG